MKVRELIEQLKGEPQDCELYVYDKDGEPEELNRIIVADNDGDTAVSIHLYNDDDAENSEELSKEESCTKSI